MSRILVIGAGLTGLSAAYHLAQRGVAATVVARAPEAGGACRTMARDGFHFDLTGHRLQLARPERAAVGPHVITRQRKDLKSSLHGLEREGFRKVHVLRSVEEVEQAVIEYEKSYNDKRELTGPFDIIGDVHGCRSELETLLVRLGYTLVREWARGANPAQTGEQ